jgi:uncharacterized protein (TIGR02145 family)
MKKTIFSVTGLAVTVAVVFLIVGCNDSGVQKVNGEAEAFLNRFSGGGENGSGTFKDARDGQIYRKVKIGNQTWMAQNLNYQTSSGSWCYDNNPSNCNTYGRLYDWSTAMSVCPTGWHLPTRQEWVLLGATAGGSNDAGIFLKSTSGWDSDGNGTDTYGFSALPGGGRGTDGSFDGAGYGGSWWTATEGNADNAYSRYMDYGDGNVYSSYHLKSYARSVRCVGD